IFLIGFSGNLYGEKVEVQVYNKLREVRRFSTPDELKRQIEDDVQQVVKVLQKIKIL
ncbi:riboflavin biosynthesis protein RibF, partial [Candidatus Gracilibacteria bacterium]|nr:riboflavin biosynthesis protein RibF [Candidatus Gracilibacteria bacterium]